MTPFTIYRSAAVHTEVKRSLATSVDADQALREYLFENKGFYYKNTTETVCWQASYWKMIFDICWIILYRMVISTTEIPI